jgi:Mg2+-importing ATPase
MAGALPVFGDRTILDAELAVELGSGEEGLSSDEAVRRLLQYGPNSLGREAGPSSLRLLLDQVASPLVLILAFAAVVSFVAGDWTDGVVVLAIVGVSAGVGFVRERGARLAIAALRARLTSEAMVMRDGRPVRIAVDQVVPGDMVMLSAGALVPADGVLWEATDATSSSTRRC